MNCIPTANAKPNRQYKGQMGRYSKESTDHALKQ